MTKLVIGAGVLVILVAIGCNNADATHEEEYFSMMVEWNTAWKENWILRPIDERYGTSVEALKALELVDPPSNVWRAHQQYLATHWAELLIERHVEDLAEEQNKYLRSIGNPHIAQCLIPDFEARGWQLTQACLVQRRVQDSAHLAWMEIESLAR